MAERCKDLSPKVSFDLIVEPSDKVKKDVAELNSLYEDCVATIRKTNPKRIIFIAPQNCLILKVLNTCRPSAEQ